MLKKMVVTAAVAVLAAGPAAILAAEKSGPDVAGKNTAGQAASAATHKTTGVVKGLDARAGTIMLAHEPVPALKWSAMTMPFKITPELAKGLKVGQRVEIEFQARDMDGTITKIKQLP
jgi:Cu(I)/Ag(I) efflux system protein CusF